MLKGKKIKRYSKIYSNSSKSSRTTPLKIIITILVIVLLAFVGWSIYTPVYNFIMNLDLDNSKPPQSSGSSSQQSVVVPPFDNSSTTIDASSTPEENSSQPNSSQTENIPLGEINTIKSQHLSHDILKDTNALKNAIASAKSAGINTFSIDIKNSVGTVFINTASPYSADAVVANADATKTAVETLKAEGFKIVGKLTALRDPLAPKLMDTDKIYYLDTEFNWLDKAPTAGGKQWLNPYSQKSLEYITTLAKEATTMGVDIILINQLNFPVGEALNTATYGPNATKVREQILGEFADACVKEVESLGGKCYINISCVDIIYPNTLVHGSGVLKAFDTDRNLDLTLPSIINSVKIGEETINFSYDKPAEGIRVILKSLNGLDTSSTIATIQGKNIATNQPYSKEIMDMQIAVLGEFGIKNYQIVY